MFRPGKLPAVDPLADNNVSELDILALEGPLDVFNLDGLDGLDLTVSNSIAINDDSTGNLVVDFLVLAQGLHKWKK